MATRAEAGRATRTFSCDGRSYSLPADPTLAISLTHASRPDLLAALEGEAMPNLAAALCDGGAMLRAGDDASGDTDPEATAILAAARASGIKVIAVTAEADTPETSAGEAVATIAAEAAATRTVEGIGGRSAADVLGEAPPTPGDAGIVRYAIELAVALGERLGAGLACCSLAGYAMSGLLGSLDQGVGRALERGWRVGIRASGAEPAMVFCQELEAGATVHREAEFFSLLMPTGAVSAAGREPYCPLCEPALGLSARIVDEDELTVSLLHPEPATEGHALVAPRRHWSGLYEVGEEDLAASAAAAQRLARKLRERLGADGVNLVNATEPAAWQSVFHFHLDVVPRYRGDSLRTPWTPRPGRRGDLERVAARLRERSPT